MIELKHIPDGLAAIVDYYGEPAQNDALKTFTLPFCLRQSWDQREVWAFEAHELVGAAMRDAILEIKEYYGLAFMRRHSLDQWGGIYNPRHKRGSTMWSTHAWGIAIDYCPDLGPFNQPGRVPWFIVEAFVKRGFVNLQQDQMHFQACKGW